MIQMEITKAFDDDTLCGFLPSATWTSQELDILMKLDAMSWPTYEIQFSAFTDNVKLRARDDETALEMARQLYVPPYEVKRIEVKFTHVDAVHVMAVGRTDVF